MPFADEFIIGIVRLDKFRIKIRLKLIYTISYIGIGNKTYKFMKLNENNGTLE